MEAHGAPDRSREPPRAAAFPPAHGVALRGRLPPAERVRCRPTRTARRRARSGCCGCCCTFASAGSRPSTAACRRSDWQCRCSPDRSGPSIVDGARARSLTCVSERSRSRSARIRRALAPDHRSLTWQPPASNIAGSTALRGPLAFVRGVPGVCASRDEVEDPMTAPGACRAGALRHGRLRPSSKSSAPPTGSTLESCRVRFHGRPLHVRRRPRSCSAECSTASGRPRDGLPPPIVVEERPIEGAPINPCRREYPRDFLETGDLGHRRVEQRRPRTEAADLHGIRTAARRAGACRSSVRPMRPASRQFAVVFAALGLPRDMALRYQESFRATGALHARRRLSQPRRRSGGGAADHAALRAYCCGVSGLRPRHARARRAHRHDQLRRGAARGCRRAR